MSKLRVYVLLTALTIGAAGVAIVSPPTASANPGYTFRCTDTVVIAVDGTPGPTTPGSLDPNSPLSPITDKFRAAPDMQVVSVAYPTGLAYPDQGVYFGENNLRDTVRSYEQLCDNPTGYVWLGYGTGAEVVQNVAAEIDADAADGGLANRVTVALFANPDKRPPLHTVPVVNYPASVLTEAGK